MRAGRVFSTCASAVAVAACAVLLTAASGGATVVTGQGSSTPDTSSSPPDTGSSDVPYGWPTDLPTPSPTPSTSASASSSAPKPSPTHAASPRKSSSTAASSAPPAVTHTSTAPALVRGQNLPLGYSTGTATRVITVVAHSYGSTTATLQAWDRAPGGGWLKHGSSVLAHVGSDGLTTHPSESLSATPIGSFTLTQAFGALSNPGTGLPYFTTTSADWWISQTTGAGAALYNTHQHCSSGCSFTLGDPNEHLMYETPFYNYAVVIDYNTRNAPGGVHVGAGSAFFLHVTDGSATAGCVAIPQSTLVSIMKWLTPTAHPRIVIGVA